MFIISCLINSGLEVISIDKKKKRGKNGADMGGTVELEYTEF